MSKPFDQMSKSLDHMQLALYFTVAGLSLSDENEEPYRLTHKVWDIVADKVEKVPGWVVRLDDHGNDSNAPDASPFLPYSLCELDFEVVELNGQAAFSLYFHASREMPLDVATGLRDLCLAELRSAFGETEVTYLKADSYRRWKVSETVAWPEV